MGNTAQNCGIPSDVERDRDCHFPSLVNIQVEIQHFTKLLTYILVTIYPQNNCRTKKGPCSLLSLTFPSSTMTNIQLDRR